MTMNLNQEPQAIWQSIDNDSLMPLNPAARAIAQQLYESVSQLPIISPHGHVDPNLLLENKPFGSPSELFIYHDHYITRLLHADGVNLEDILSPRDETVHAQQHARKAWQILASHWQLLAGTASGYWLVRELRDIFGIEAELNLDNADEIYDQIDTQLQTPRLLPQQLFRDFKIEFLATTDSPSDDLAAHRALKDIGLPGKIVPTFRPDSFINALSTGFSERVKGLINLTGTELSHAGFIESLQIRREYFKQHGAVSVDIGAETAFTTILDETEASELFLKAIDGTITEQQALRYRGHMIAEMIRMSCEDGLVITLHVGVARNHSKATFDKYGPDTGHDIPIAAEFTKNLQPVLERYGLNPNLHLVLFSLDETTWSREVAPLAGFYPSVFIGAPWWFLDAPAAATRFRDATIETAGFYRGSGFIDDTRAFLSIPARHDMARRVDSAFLANLVVQKRITLNQAQQIAIDLVTKVPRRAFKL